MRDQIASVCGVIALVFAMLSIRTQPEICVFMFVAAGFCGLVSVRR